jgi:hypothetical protein
MPRLSDSIACMFFLGAKRRGEGIYFRLSRKDGTQVTENCELQSSFYVYLKHALAVFGPLQAKRINQGTGTERLLGETLAH